MSIDTLLRRLDKVVERRSGQWLARCPAHDDKRPSLALTKSDSGSILLHCFAGCEPADILGAVGLDMSALFDDDYVEKHKKLIHYEQQQRQVKQKQTRINESLTLSEEAKDKLILQEARRRRKAGIALSEKDMQLELNAYMRTRGRLNANTSR